MTSILLYTIIIGIPLLWIVTHLMLVGMDYYKWFLIGNLLVFALGIWIYNVYHSELFGHDEYGLGYIIAPTIQFSCQVLISFILALILKARTKRLSKPS